MKASTSIILFAFLIFGCTDRTGTGIAEDRAAVAEAGPDEILLADYGLDGYPAGSSFDADLVREAVPGYTVREGEAMSEGMSWTVFLVEDGDELMLEIGPDPMGTRVGTIHTTSPRVATNTGHKVGDRFSDVYSEQEANCEAGMEEMSGTVLCPVPDMVQIYYRFEGDFNGPDGEVPPLDVLENWLISSVVWSIY